MTAQTAEQQYMAAAVAAGCVIGNRRLGMCTGRVEFHHIAQGSGERSDFCGAGLCTEHHTGTTGWHGMGARAFLRLYRPPGDCEYGLMVWSAQDMAWLKRYHAVMPFRYDPDRDVFDIYGVTYSGILFRSFAIAQPGNWIRIHERKDGLVTLYQPSEAEMKALDAITAQGGPR